MRAETAWGRLVQIQGSVLQAIFGRHLILIPQRSTIPSQRGFKEALAEYEKKSIHKAT